jgi:hypothetical protein
MVKAHWGLTFRKAGSKVIKFDALHLAQKTGEGSKIMMFIAHQDEQKTMQELGLTQPKTQSPY